MGWNHLVTRNIILVLFYEIFVVSYFMNVSKISSLLHKSKYATLGRHW